MQDHEEQIAQFLHDSYAELAPMFGWEDNSSMKSWNSLNETRQKHMIALVDKLLKDGIIEPGRFFRYIRMGGGSRAQAGD